MRFHQIFSQPRNGGKQDVFREEVATKDSQEELREEITLFYDDIMPGHLISKGESNKDEKVSPPTNIDLKDAWVSYTVLLG